MCLDEGMIQIMDRIPLSFYWFDHNINKYFVKRLHGDLQPVRGFAG